MEKNKSEIIPIPMQAVEIHKKMKAGVAVQQLQLENVLLKHLVSTIDPEHDYVMDLDHMTLTKVKKDEKPIQPGPGEAPEGRGPSVAGGETERSAPSDLRGLKAATPKEAGGGI